MALTDDSPVSHHTSEARRRCRRGSCLTVLTRQCRRIVRASCALGTPAEGVANVAHAQFSAACRSHVSALQPAHRSVRQPRPAVPTLSCQPRSVARQTVRSGPARAQSAVPPIHPVSAPSTQPLVVVRCPNVSPHGRLIGHSLQPHFGQRSGSDCVLFQDASAIAAGRIQ